MSRDDVLLTIAVLTLLFSALNFFSPFLRRTWKNWLQFRWFRAVVALREDRSYTRVDLPNGIKWVLHLLLHPRRRSFGGHTLHERTIRQFLWCPFYNPTRCVKPRQYAGSSLKVSCPKTECYKLGSPDENISERKHSPHSPPATVMAISEIPQS